MDKRTEIIASAARVFDAEGFRGIGVDRIIAPSGVSTRTLYKHFGSRDGLVMAVLETRHLSFITQLKNEASSADPIGSLFDTLRFWMESRGTHGCMLLRARSEYGEANEDIVALVQRRKNEFRDEIAKRVQSALGRESDELSAQIWLLFEGATAAASVSDIALIDPAKRAALMLLMSMRASDS
ncbi:TetR/AcrR family transcriptional regulator [Pseudomonas mucidolens]|uniref:Transcriptional regulator, TetR family n=1 Tax=Pseudomonas mucidolens TaxID=46679 RepID=A0A1H2P3P4_9PSED|nr:TetR/AcrR family transcriptional regulator [Pseudomonas mucidolens]SDV12327.1 transcriptional regulator, TetR family [Pseudomonas mucidolens]SQH36268.1 TetR family transcriptional regulator [Pseudomonas mucidolens]